MFSEILGEGDSGRGTHVNPWLIHVNVWQKPLQYGKVISLQLIKIIGKKKYLPYPLATTSLFFYVCESKFLFKH